jgi:hypothetical protein
MGTCDLETWLDVFALAMTCWSDHEEGTPAWVPYEALLEAF